MPKLKLGQMKLNAKPSPEAPAAPETDTGKRYKATVYPEGSRWPIVSWPVKIQNDDFASARETLRAQYRERHKDYPGTSPLKVDFE